MRVHKHKDNSIYLIVDCGILFKSNFFDAFDHLHIICFESWILIIRYCFVMVLLDARPEFRAPDLYF